MTDYEKLKALLTEFGVEFRFVEEEGDCKEKFIECFSGDNKVTGYSGFYTSFGFDRSGKFIEMGAWE
jgi:hypothetical protein